MDASIMIVASKEMVAAIVADYTDWPCTFPTIRSVRLIREDGEKQVLEVDHVEGVVPNEMVAHLPNAVDLSEVKRRYDALFLNRFDTVPGGTRYTVHGIIRLKGIARLLRPVRASADRAVDAGAREDCGGGRRPRHQLAQPLIADLLDRGNDSNSFPTTGVVWRRCRDGSPRCGQIDT